METQAQRTSMMKTTCTSTMTTSPATSVENEDTTLTSAEPSPGGSLLQGADEEGQAAAGAEVEVAEAKAGRPTTKLSI